MTAPFLGVDVVYKGKQPFGVPIEMLKSYINLNIIFDT